MIVRYWRGVTHGDSADEYQQHLETQVFPALAKIDGHQSVQLLRRPVGDQCEFIVLTYWASIEAIREFAGDDYEMAVVPPAAQAFMADFDRKVAHYELVIQNDCDSL